MLRSLLFVAKLAVVVAVAVWLATQPSRVAIEILGYQVETSVGILILLVFLVAVVTTIVYRYWRLLIGAPGDFGKLFRESRRRRGYKALTQGMVAVAAGDPDEARKWSRKAQVLKEEPPLTLLLAAQAAQLNGDDQAAKRYFEAMLESEETKFLGLRGCLMQALRSGDNQAALGYVREAHGMRPKTPWVLTALFDLSEATGDLIGAEQALRQASRAKALPPAEATRKRAVVLLQQAQKAQRGGQAAEAQKLAREALKLAPSLVPAAVLLAESLIAGGRSNEAERLLIKNWHLMPHPDLARLFLGLGGERDALAQLDRLKRLTASKADHDESRLALATAALDAKLWGEARRYLAPALTGRPREAICRLMARLEEAEYGDVGKTRQWLERAATAPRDPAWVCGSCGAIATVWDAHCGACRSFDSLAWGQPVEIAPLALASPAAVPALPAAASPPSVPEVLPPPAPGVSAGAPRVAKEPQES